MCFAVDPVLEGGGIAEQSGASSSATQPADVTFGYRWRGVGTSAARVGIGGGEAGRKGKESFKGRWRRRLTDELTGLLRSTNLHQFKC